MPSTHISRLYLKQTLTHNGDLDVVSGPLSMNETAIALRRLELKEDVPGVTHVETRQVDGGVGFPESDGVVINVCGGERGV